MNYFLGGRTNFMHKPQIKTSFNPSQGICHKLDWRHNHHCKPRSQRPPMQTKKEIVIMRNPQYTTMILLSPPFPFLTLPPIPPLLPGTIVNSIIWFIIRMISFGGERGGKRNKTASKGGIVCNNYSFWTAWREDRKRK